MSVLVLVNWLYEWSQNFITRELVELKRQGLDLHVGARKVLSRDDLTKDEANLKKILLLSENPFKPVSLRKHIAFKLRHPRNYGRAWGHVFGSGHRQPSKIGRSLVCLFRAAAVAEEVVSRKINLIHAHFLTAPTETARYLSVLTNIPFGCTGHAMDIYKDNSSIREKMTAARYVTTCTEANALYINGLYPELRSKLHTVHHGIAIKTQSPCLSSNEPFTFLAVGRLTAKKGFANLIDACRLLADAGRQFKCHIVGEGPLHDQLKGLLQQLHLHQHLALIGYIPPHRMKEIYQSSHVLVVPSVIEDNGDRDGLPNVCLEAMSYGLPIIGTNISGIPEGVIDWVNGRLVQPQDPKALSEAMAFFLDSDDREQMGAESIRLIREKFNLTKNVEKLKTIMEHAAN
ncbi:glycosyltransferase family 4 protein [bacterium]|nr:glycosyltransferase family 4 protein [bacterium]